MKKLFTLLLTAALIFTACGEEKPVYETFSFDQSAVVQTKLSDPGDDHGYREIQSFDKKGRLVRNEYRMKRQSDILWVAEYDYNFDGSYTVRTQHAPAMQGKAPYVVYEKFGKDGQILSMQEFLYWAEDRTYLITCEKIYRYEGANTCYTQIHYDNSRKETQRYEVVLNDKNQSIEHISYTGGLLRERQYTDRQEDVTVYKTVRYNNGYFLEAERSTYDNTTNLAVKFEVLDEKDNVLKTLKHYYSPEGIKCAQEHFDRSGNLVYSYKYIYNRQEKYYTDTYAYYPDGRLYQHITFDQNGFITQYREYDRAGNLISTDPYPAAN